MKTTQEKTIDFDSYINRTYDYAGKEFDNYTAAAAYARNYPKSIITKLMKGVLINSPKSTEGLHKVVQEYKDLDGAWRENVFWFERVPNGRYLVSLA